MVESNMSRVLSEVFALKQYLPYDIEMHFNKATMPNLGLWEKLTPIINDGPF